MPCQQIDYLGAHLDSYNVCFNLTVAKRAKCMLCLYFLDKINSISVRLFHRLLGFFNFIFELVPCFKSFLRIWYNHLKSFKSSRLKFSPVPVQTTIRRDLLTSPNFYRTWAGGLESKPLVCFSDATPSRVAFVSDRGVFSKPLPLQLPVLNWEFLAGYACLLIANFLII